MLPSLLYREEADVRSSTLNPPKPSTSLLYREQADVRSHSRPTHTIILLFIQMLALSSDSSLPLQSLTWSAIVG